MDEVDEKSKLKKHRKRKRNHYNAIRTQMEFYFGDANLTKDRFLKQLTDKDPFVPLDVFLTFNKMKTLASSIEEISKALSNSQMLELDETQQKVRRKTALPPERNVDEKTLYVEALPPKADHDWVRSVFERFGVVTYVSLPKYAKSRKIKEFGFVEFEHELSVTKAIKAFSEFNGVLQMQAVDPAELKSVKAFIKEQAQDDIEDTKSTRKRIKCEEGDSLTEEPLTKKIKTEHEENSTNTAPEDDEEDQSTASETAEGTADEEKTQGNEQTKKRRKKKKKPKTGIKNSDLSLDAPYYELKVLPKRDWKRLRNQYLNLQREKMAELKRIAWKERQQQAMQQAKENSESADVTSAPPTKKLKHSERKLPKVNMNFYGAGDEESQVQKTITKDIKQNPALERTPLFSYEPGLIVEVNLLEPCVNVKEFKVDMRQYTTVKYVDIKEGAMHAHLRLETASAADDFVRQVSCAEYNCKVLSGEAETEYWKKIELDREMKLNKQVKVPQKRGREKMKKLVTKHIRFDDEE